MNNKYSVACITLVRDKYKKIPMVYAWYIRPIRFEIRFERKKTIRRSVASDHSWHAGKLSPAQLRDGQRLTTALLIKRSRERASTLVITAR